MPDNPWFRRPVLVYDEHGRPVRWDIEKEAHLRWYREIDAPFFLRARRNGVPMVDPGVLVLANDGIPFARTRMAGASDMTFPDKDPHDPPPPPYPCGLCEGRGFLRVVDVIVCPRCFPYGDRPSQVARIEIP